MNLRDETETRLEKKHAGYKWLTWQFHCIILCYPSKFNLSTTYHESNSALREREREMASSPGSFLWRMKAAFVDITADFIKRCHTRRPAGTCAVAARFLLVGKRLKGAPLSSSSKYVYMKSATLIGPESRSVRS